MILWREHACHNATPWVGAASSPLDSSRGSTAPFSLSSVVISEEKKSTLWFGIEREGAQYLSHPLITRSVTDGAEAVHQRLMTSTQKVERLSQRKLPRDGGEGREA